MRTLSLAVNPQRETFQTRMEESTQKGKFQNMKAFSNRMTRAIYAIAIPAIIIVALANIPVINADKFTDCIDNCDKIDGSFAKTLCYTLCGILSIFA